MDQISRIGMDTSKHIFQLHGANAAEEPILRRKLQRKDMIAFFERLTMVDLKALWKPVTPSFVIPSGHRPLLPYRSAGSTVRKDS